MGGARVSSLLSALRVIETFLRKQLEVGVCFWYNIVKTFKGEAL